MEESGYGGSRAILKADKEIAIADVQKIRSGESVPKNSLGSNVRVENAVKGATRSC